MPTPHRIVVVGSIALDTLQTPHGSAEDCVGGSASYAALAASYDARVNLVAVVGSDFPVAARELFDARGIDTVGLEVVEGATFRWGGRYHGDMNHRDTLFTHLNVFEHFHPKLPDAYRDSEVVFLANIHPTLQMEVLEQVRSPRFVALDTMNLWIDRAREDLIRVLGHVDLVFVNEEEARQLTGARVIGEAAHAIAQMGPKIVVVKRGEHGSILFDADGGVHVQPAVLLDRVVDPTGAGDAFAGGFLGHLAQCGAYDSLAMRRAMVHGTILASFTTEAFGPDRLVSLLPAHRAKRIADLERTTRWPLP